MKERIKRAATDLLIRNGYRGASFADIAKPLGITTANIHYHFGNKQRLVEAAVTDYVAGSLAGHQRVWLDEATTLRAKLRAVVAFNRARYRRFNRGKTAGRPWSLIARLRLEGEVVGALAGGDIDAARAAGRVVDDALAAPGRVDDQAGVDGADDAADGVDAESVEAVIVLQGVLHRRTAGE